MPDPQPSAAQLSEDGFTTPLGRMTECILGTYARHGRIHGFEKTCLVMAKFSDPEIDAYANKAIAQAREIFSKEKKDG